MHVSRPTAVVLVCQWAYCYCASMQMTVFESMTTVAEMMSILKLKLKLFLKNFITRTENNSRYSIETYTEMFELKLYTN